MKPFHSTDHMDARKNIFISYREKDTAGETGRLVDALKEHFDDSQIFMDIEKIEPGVDFTEAISKSLQLCDVFLAIIGPNWLGKREAGATARIFDPNDWVRIEVATALQRNIRLIPVLVDDGIMPKEEELPPDLHPLLKRQAYELSNRRWKYDTEQFIYFLIHSVGIQTKNVITSPEKPDVTRSWWAKNKAWILVLAGILAIGIFFISRESRTDTINKQDHITQTNLQDTSLSDEKVATSQLDTIENSSSTTSAEKGTIDGAWEEQDAGAKSTFYIKNNGGQLTVDIHSLGQKISTGTGRLDGKSVELKFDMFGSNVVVKAVLSADKRTMKGTYLFEVTGEELPLILKKKE